MIRSFYRFHPIRLAMALLFGSCALLPAVARAADTYTLKISVTPGAKWSFDVTSSVKQKGQVTANGQPAQQIDMSLAQRRKGSVEVLSANGGAPTAMRITYDEESANTGSTNGQQAPAFALAGKTITVRRGEGGAITNDLPTPPDAATAQELAKLLEPDMSIYPKQPVSVGDEWDGDNATLSKQFQLGPDDKVSLKCKLLGIKDLDGHQVADVSLAAHITKREQNFIDTQTTLGGVSRVDLQTGQTIAAELIGQVTSKGASQANGADGNPVNYEVSAQGKLEMHQSVKLASAGPDNVAPAPENPLGGGSAKDPFAGVFRGKEMSLELKGTKPHYNGTLTFSGKEFPVVATAEGEKLSGTFESEGTKFNFTATVESTTLTLSSDGTTYSLKKASVNPLAAPKPRNPLSD